MRVLSTTYAARGEVRPPVVATGVTSTGGRR